jgi:ankyrin repeat protein
LDAVNKNDETPLDIARKMKNQKIITLLNDSMQVNEKIYKPKKKNNNIVLKLN